MPTRPYEPPPLPYEQALRILLEGVCGANPAEIGRETGLSRKAIAGFLAGDSESRADTVEAIGLFVWRRLNAHLLLTADDLRP